MKNYLFSQLDQKLQLWSANNLRYPKLVIVGVGNEFFGDDAAGVLVLQELKRKQSENENILFIEASTAPENFTGPIRKFNPDWIWIIDAADMDITPGEIKILSMDQIDGVSSLSHRMPPSLLSKYLFETTGAEIILLGIQPQETGVYVEVTNTIRNSVRNLGEFLYKWVNTNFE